MSGGAELPAAPDWQGIRRDYEQGSSSLHDLAERAGLKNWQQLAQRAHQEGWALRRKARPKAHKDKQTFARLKKLLHERLSALEAEIGDMNAAAHATGSERDIRAMNTLVRTLEKVLELERKERAHKRKRRNAHRALDDAEREALAGRLEALARQRRDGDDGAGDPRRQS